MRPLKWSKSRSVFVPDIDDEHKEIYQILGELQTALTGAAPLFEIQETLHRLISATEDHLTHEERLMVAGNYESFDWHKQQHDTARKRFRQFAPLIEQGDVAAGNALVAFLSNWLHDHTGLTDRMMGAFLRNQRRGQIN